MKHSTTSSYFRIIAILIASVTLQGCIVLLPVIESNQAAERQAMIHAGGEKTCPLTDGLGLEQNVKFDSLAEAQAFVAAHKTRTAKIKAQRRVVMTSGMKRDLLIEQLRNGTEVARTHAATDLGTFGKNSKEAVHALSRSLRYDESKWVRRAAVKSLAKISGHTVIEPLRFALNDTNPWVVHSAKNALRKVERELGSKPVTTVTPVVYRAN